MFTGMELMACHTLSVPAEVMQHVIHVESSNNPYAIGVVGGQLVRQPQTLPEAIATAQMLDEKGYNYSLGVAQINRANLGKYGLESFEQAFDPCPNVTAGSRILAACYASSGKDWGKAFSCYYSGNFVTGYRDGYVQKIYDSINRSSNPGSTETVAIPLRLQSGNALTGNHGTLVPSRAADRVALRSEIIDTAAALVVKKAASSIMSGPVRDLEALPSSSDQAEVSANAPAAVAAPTAAPMTNIGAPSSSIFVPMVRGPNDPTTQAAAVAQASAAPLTTARPAVRDHADLRQEKDDAAFVF